jgi:hypothetical protein
VIQAGAFLALLLGAVVAAPPAAQAAGPSVEVENLQPTNLRAGQTATLKYSVTNTDPVPQLFEITVTSTVAQLTCARGSCNVKRQEIGPNARMEFTATLVAGTMESGQSVPGKVVVRATSAGGTDDGPVDVTVRGDDRSPTVQEISGKVRDDTGKSVSGAEVAIQDSAGHRYTTTTNGSGRFRFTSSDEQPIAPGTVIIGAQKDGFKIVTQNLNTQAGKSFTVALTMRSETAPTTSPSASASPTASVEPTAEPSEAQTSQAATLNAAPAAGKDDEGGSSSLMFLIIGGLLVAAGIGAFVLVLMRRKDPDADVEPDGDEPAGARSGAVAPSQVRYAGANDATRVANLGADATMVTGAAVPSISDAPTMLQQAVPADPADEFPDPYGAPAAVPHAGYAAARPSGWGAAPAAGAVPAAGVAPAAGATAAAAAAGTYGVAKPAAVPYGAATPPAPATPTGTYGAASVPGSYGVPAQPAPTYGNPADMYGAPPANQYGRPPAQGGHGGPAGAQPYGQPSSGAGYGGAPQAPGGGYGPGDQQRYDEPTGRYDPAAGGGAGGYRGAGYEPASGYAGGHDQGGYRPQDSGRPQDQGRSQDHGGSPQSGRAPQPEYPQPGRQQPGSGAPYQAGVPYQGGAGYQSGGGYPPAAGGGSYPAAAEPNEPANPYGAWSPGGGIDSGNAYGPPAGTYGRGSQAGGAPAGGYDEPTGYGPRATYGRPEGYGAPDQTQPGRVPQGGYEQPGYYGGEQPPQGGGRHGVPPTPPEQNQPNQRRPLDWLDD